MPRQVVAGVFMVLLFVVGSCAWWSPEDEADAFLPSALSSEAEAAARRLFSAHAVARWCCAVVLGELVLWDIPCGLLVPSLRDPLM